jgi:D-glycerate 3-kinase
MRESKESGMSDEQVISFVNGCKSSTNSSRIRVLTRITDYPAYELYTEVLRNGIFGDEKGKQLRFVVGKDRKVKEVYRI